MRGAYRAFAALTSEKQNVSDCKSSLTRQGGKKEKKDHFNYVCKCKNKAKVPLFSLLAHMHYSFPQTKMMTFVCLSI